MAIATQKKKLPKKVQKPSKSQPKAATGRKHTTKRVEKPRQPKAAPNPLDDIEEPDRSSPSLAEVDSEALEFIAAIDRFKKENGRPFPSWSEVLLVLRQLGYRRT